MNAANDVKNVGIQMILLVEDSVRFYSSVLPTLYKFILQQSKIFSTEALPIYTDSKTALAWVRNRHCKTTLTRTAENAYIFDIIHRAEKWLQTHAWGNPIIKWQTDKWGEIPADFGRK